LIYSLTNQRGEIVRGEDRTTYGLSEESSDADRRLIPANEADGDRVSYIGSASKDNMSIR
jgi:hypothetical protein